MKKYLVVFVFSIFTLAGLAQHDEHDSFHAHHTLGLMISHTQVSQGIQENGKKKWLALPSWGINYNYKFSRKWAIGLHNDIITENFLVEEHEGSVLERSVPVASAIMASFKPGKHFSYLFGAGGEFAHTGNLFLVRLGAEYGHHINKKWELNANTTYDIRLNAYNSWAIGIGVTRVL